MIRALLLCCSLAVAGPLCAQTQVDSAYEQAYDRITDMLEGRATPSFKQAVFEVENAYFLGALDPVAFNVQIHRLASIAEAWAQSNKLDNYHAKDSVTFLRNGAVFHLMTDTIFIAPGIPINLPYRYDTVDFFAWHDWLLLSAARFFTVWAIPANRKARW